MSEFTGKPVLLAMSTPSYWHCGRTIQKSSYAMLMALTPAAVMAVYTWGMSALAVMALAIATGVAVEALCQKCMGREITVDDFTAVVSSLLLAFLLPADAPWWLVIIGVGLAISLGKMAFGGFGCNPLSIAAVGWAMLYISWPVLVDPNSVQLETLWTDPLVHLKYLGTDGLYLFDLSDMMVGQQVGALGASQGLALFVGGMFLVARRYIHWEIVAGFFVALFVTATAYYIVDSDTYASPMFHLFAGSTILGGFFLATEHACAPQRPLPMMIYGALGGVLVIIIRTHSIHLDGVPFAILLINLVAPLLDCLRPKPFSKR